MRLPKYTLLPDQTNEIQEKDPHMHFCNACALIAPVVPADSEGRHLNCPEAEFPHVIGVLKDTKEDWLHYTNEQKQEAQDRINYRAKAVHDFCLEGRARRAAIKNIKCPFCKSYNTRELTAARKGFSLGFWGIFSRIQNYDYQCLNCHRKW